MNTGLAYRQKTSTRSSAVLDLLCFFLGFVIYFGYGIWHSTEAALASNDTEEINTFKPTLPNEPATPEKEAFLRNGFNVRAEESSDP